MCDLTALTDIALLIKHESLRDRCAQQLNIFLAISVTKMLDHNTFTGRHFAIVQEILKRL